MKKSLVVGIEGEAVYTVTAEMAPGHLPVVVLSTPAMIGLIEATCLAAVQEHLEGAETTVGTHVCVSHAGPAYEGEDFVVRCRLTGIDRARLTFAVEAEASVGLISEGTHERAVVDPARFGGGP
jgi:fluoroacetyl-CoA thioesterase